ncbi:MAG: hypothetical protein IJI34_03270 [Clostridia bacterium]|nr:hypothetical protein [Clostridia bacterium]
MYNTRPESRTHFRVRYDAEGHKLFYRKSADGKWILVSPEVFRIIRSSVRKEEYEQEAELEHGFFSLSLLNDEPKGQSSFIYTVDSPEDLLISSENKIKIIHQVQEVIESFSISDQALIWYVIVNDMKSSEYAAKIGVHRDTVSRRKRLLTKILCEKLSTLYESYRKGTL